MKSFILAQYLHRKGVSFLGKDEAKYRKYIKLSELVASRSKKPEPQFS